MAGQTHARSLISRFRSRKRDQPAYAFPTTLLCMDGTRSMTRFTTLGIDGRGFDRLFPMGIMAQRLALLIVTAQADVRAYVFSR